MSLWASLLPSRRRLTVVGTIDSFSDDTWELFVGTHWRARCTELEADRLGRLEREPFVRPACPVITTWDILRAAIDGHPASTTFGRGRRSPMKSSTASSTSPDANLIRSLIPPTSERVAFADADQRIYMSAMLGGGGELERSFGVTKIHTRSHRGRRSMRRPASRALAVCSSPSTPHRQGSERASPPWCVRD